MIKKGFISLVLLVCLCTSVRGQTFTFECVGEFISGAECPECTGTTTARLFNGLMIKRSGAYFRNIDCPYIVKQQGANLVFQEILNPNPETVTVNLLSTGFSTITGFRDSTACMCARQDSSWIGGGGDPSITNEGILGVAAGGSNDALLTSNTSTANGVTYSGSTTILVTETTSANGGTILFRADTSVLATVTDAITNLSYTGASSPVTLNSSTGADVTITAGTSIGLTATGTNLTITNTDPDQSTTNELQTIANTSDATSHTATLSNSGGSLQLVEGTGIGIATTGTGLDGIATLTNTLPDQVVSITGAGISVVTGTYPNFTVTSTEVDGSITNEGSLTVGAGGANTSTIVSNTSASTPVTVSGSNTILVTESGSTITVQGDTSLLATVNDINTARNRDDSTFARLAGELYHTKRISSNAYRYGTTGFRTTDTTGVVNIKTITGKTGEVITADTSGEGTRFLSLDPPNFTNLPNLQAFNFYAQRFNGVNSPLSTRPNYVWGFGHNLNSNGVRINPHEASAGIHFETYFQNASLGSGLTGFTEFHIFATDTLASPHTTRFITAVNPWDGRRWVSQLTFQTDNLSFNDDHSNAIWAHNVFTNIWTFSDTTGLTFSEPRGFALSVQNGANSAAMNIIDFANTDTLQIARQNVAGVRFGAPPIFTHNKIYPDYLTTGLEIGSTVRKHNLIVNSPNTQAIELRTGITTGIYGYNASPDAVITANPGSIAQTNIAGAGGLWLKESGTGTTTWRQLLTTSFGSGANTRVTFWTGTNTIGSDADFTWDGTKLGITGVPVGQTDALSILNTNAGASDQTQVHFYNDAGSTASDGAFFGLASSGRTAPYANAMFAWNAENGPFVVGTNNTEKFRVQPSGNTGIGTTAPASKLDVEGGVSIGATYSGTTAAPTNGAIIEGNVGIGNSSPSQPLHVTGNARVTGAIYDSNNDPGSSGQVLSSTVTGTDWIAAAAGVSGSGVDNQVAIWSGTSTLDGDADFTFDGAVAALARNANDANNVFTLRNSSAGAGAQTGFQMWNDAGAGAAQGGKVFLTSSTTASPYANAWGFWHYLSGPLVFAQNNAERMRITANGLIIGSTANAASKLDVEGGASIGAAYSGTTAAPANGAIIEGSVGIGNNSPQRTLHVTGEVRITDVATDTPTKILGVDGDGDVDTVGISAENELYFSGGSLGTNFHTTIAPATLTAVTNNWNPTGLSTAWIIELSGNGTFVLLTGIAAPTFNKTLTLYNSGTNSICLPKEFTTSTAGNRFNFELILFPGKQVEIRYSLSAARWTLKSKAGLYEDVQELYSEHIFRAPVSTTTADYDFWAVNSEAAASLVAPAAGIMSGVSVNTGTSASGNGDVSSKTVFFQTDNTSGTVTYAYCKAVVKTPASLSDGTNDYMLRVGFNVQTAGAGASDGIYFDYNHNNVSGNWGCNTTNGGNTQRNNSGIAVTTSTVYVLEVIIRPSLLVEYFINGTRVATNDTFVSTGDDMLCLAEIEKSIGTAQRDFEIFTLQTNVALVDRP